MERDMPFAAGTRLVLTAFLACIGSGRHGILRYVFPSVLPK